MKIPHYFAEMEKLTSEKVVKSVLKMSVLVPLSAETEVLSQLKTAKIALKMFLIVEKKLVETGKLTKENNVTMEIKTAKIENVLLPVFY